MPLAPGTRLGPYEITAPLGAGGMGEVYHARDTRLGREVAIKALPAGFAQDPERLARFEREAKLLASLSHPNIAGIYGLEVVDGHRYLVLEFVAGETLAARIARGALPIDEAIDVCRQIAAGVEAAHESGVIHRDLKPGNVMLAPSGEVKVLDFGLAKPGAAGGAESGVALADSPTVTRLEMSGAGSILGTAAYMSPEQARGRVVDRRTDIWSFGCVLYECLTGRPVHSGETVSDLIAGILEREPDWTTLPAATPPRVQILLARCLTKDPKLRLRDIGEARIALGHPGVDPGSAPPAGRPTRRWMAPLITGGVAVVATAAAFLVLRPSPPAGPVRRFRVVLEGFKTSFLSPFALSRDGRQLAYPANDHIWIRRMDRLDALEVPGSKGGNMPFWSWDQKTLGFVADKKLWTFVLGTDQSQNLCNIPESGEIVGGAWGADARIVVAVWRAGLYDVPAAGGELRLLLAADSSTVDFHSPSFLPDGRTLILVVHDKAEQSGVAILGGSPAHLKRIFDDPKVSLVSYSPTGHLLVARDVNAYRSTTWAVPFSAARRKVTGPAFLVLDGAAFASASSNGVLAAVEDKPPQQGQLVWARRDGDGVEAIGEPQPGLAMPALSPDGGRVAYVAVHDGNPDVWVQDLGRGTRTRLTSSDLFEGLPAWSPDGNRIYYSSRGGVPSMRILGVAADGSGSVDTLANGFAPSPSPDGKSLAYTVDRRGDADLWTVRLDQGKAAQPFLATPHIEAAPSISPDGRWIAYVSDESGRLEVYIRRYPENDARAQVSVHGGTWPRWSRRGDGIYYVQGDTLYAVPVGPGPHPVLGLPRPLFSLASGNLEMSSNAFAGAPMVPNEDGSRFITVKRTDAPTSRVMLIVENWFEEFRKR